MSHTEKEHLFNKRNYIVLLVGSIFILTGFILMSGDGSTLTSYNPDIFSHLRIRVAPLFCVAGYLINIVGIIISPFSFLKYTRNRFH